MSYDWKGQTDMFYDDDAMDRAVAKAGGRGAAIGFIAGFLVALAVFTVVGVYI